MKYAHGLLSQVRLESSTGEASESCGSLGVKIGDIYAIRRTTVLSIFLVIVNISVQALLLLTIDHAVD